MEKEKIGIMGGSFNPIHMGHLLLANTARFLCNLDRVIFIPTGEHPFKEAMNQPSAADRLKMVQLAIARNPCFELSDMEIFREGICYTIDTVHALQSLYPDSELYLITGADIIFELDRWHEKEQLLKELFFITAYRPGYDASELDAQIPEMKKKYGLQVEKIEVPQMDFSSSDIRKRLQKGQPVTYMIPEPVEAYIYKKGLYCREKAHDERTAD